MSYFASPAHGRTTSEWGPRHLAGRAPGFHRGLDIAPPKPGQRGVPVHAAYGGEVIFVRDDSYNGDTRGNQLTGTWNTGKIAAVRGPGGGVELYGHFDKVRVRRGQSVDPGDVLGDMGDTGNIGRNAVHLHFETWTGGTQGGGNGAGNTLDPRFAFATFGIFPGQSPDLILPGLLDRTTWTTSRPGFPAWPDRIIRPDQVRSLYGHYPGDGNHIRAGLSREASLALIRGYREFHINTRGWADLGYPWIITQAGDIIVGAGSTNGAAHSATPLRPDENQRSQAVLLLIGNNEQPSSAMIEAMKRLRTYLRGFFTSMTAIDMHGHIPGANTACAGKHVATLLRQKAFDGTPSSSIPPTERTWFDMATREDLINVIRTEAPRAVWGHELPDLAHPDGVPRSTGSQLQQARRHSELALNLSAGTSAVVTALESSRVNPAALADALMATLPAAVAGQVADELAKRRAAANKG